MHCDSLPSPKLFAATLSEVRCILGLATDPPLGPNMQSAVVVEAVPDVIRNAICTPEERCPSDVDELETLEDVCRHGMRKVELD